MKCTVYNLMATNGNEINHYLNSKSFDSGSSVIGKLGDIDNENKANKEHFETDVPLKHLNNFGEI